MVGLSLVATSRQLLAVETMHKAALARVTTLPPSFMPMRLLVVWVSTGLALRLNWPLRVGCTFCNTLLQGPHLDQHLQIQWDALQTYAYGCHAE